MELASRTLRIFIDDSGKDDPPVFVLGGIVIDSEQIEPFELAWQAALAASPAIPYFKMKEANARRGVFKGMSIADRDAKVARLGTVLRAHAVATLSVVVRHDDYRRIYEGQMMRSLDRPYRMMFHLAVIGGYKLCGELDLGDRAEFVFDRQIEHETAIRDSFSAMKPELVPELASFLAADPRHADDKNEVGLQAADMIAWHVRRSWREGTEGLAKASNAGPAIVAIPGRHDLINERTLRSLAQVATKAVRGLNTIFPYEAARISEHFDRLATLANFGLMADAMPLHPVELISFPAIGTGKFQLVHRCVGLGRPHLHRRSENRCLGEASAA